MNRRKSLAAAVAVSLLAVALHAQRGDAGPPSAQQHQQGGCCVADAPSTQPAAAASDAEKQSLLRMRREEKLAHDVYVTLGRTYALRPFQHIPHSERQHAQAVAALMARYGVPDPVAALPEGKFDDPAVQELFDALVAKGVRSQADALKVGAEIEEMDIKDLRAESARTDKPDLKAAYAALESASGNHLRAFVRNLATRGGTYAARHLDQKSFDRVIAGTAGCGDCD